MRDATGHLVIQRQDTHVDLPIADTQIPLPMRKGGNRVVAVGQLRRDIIAKEQALQSKYPGAELPPLPEQTGAAGFAISVLNPPWRQRFEGQGGSVGRTGTGNFNSSIGITATVESVQLQLAIRSLVS